ncbi:MAG: 4Fe-4S binding protein [Deltaproteobacteria bacterium]|nr:4Fe-4S binding protein [Deltaproteobacteria bacterium]
MQEQVKEWLKQGKVDIFLGYKMVEGHPLPHFFSKDDPDEVNELITGTVRYPLEKMATKIAAQHPDIKIGLLVRDCNQRALNVLYVWNQLNPEKVETINVNCCPSKLKEHADCSYLEPEKPGSCKVEVGVDNTLDIAGMETYSQQDRFARWNYEFQKCIKCYGCRDICPVCFCKECSLEHTELIGTGDLPPEVPIFHLVRAVHMAGRCIDCGLCEDACPAGIPLRLLYSKVNEIVTDVFDYETGTSPSQSPFNILGEEVTLEPKPINNAA